MTKKTNGNVIKGPWETKEKNKSISAETLSNEAKQITDGQEFAEKLTEQTVVHAIHNLNKNGIDIDNRAFIYDMGLVIELIKGCIYRNIGFTYPTHMIGELLKKLSLEKDAISFLKTISREQITEILMFLESIKREHLNDDNGPDSA